MNAFSSSPKRKSYLLPRKKPLFSTARETAGTEWELCFWWSWYWFKLSNCLCFPSTATITGSLSPEFFLPDGSVSNVGSSAFTLPVTNTPIDHLYFFDGSHSTFHMSSNLSSGGACQTPLVPIPCICLVTHPLWLVFPQAPALGLMAAWNVLTGLNHRPLQHNVRFSIKIGTVEDTPCLHYGFKTYREHFTFTPYLWCLVIQVLLCLLLEETVSGMNSMQTSASRSISFEILS